MGHKGRRDPDELARELKTVLRAGTRPARLVDRLSKTPGLQSLAAIEPGEGNHWTTAIAVCNLVQRAVVALGDGPYGTAAAELLGVSAATRGLLLSSRRAAAASTLGVLIDTFVRHWEPEIMLDLAVNLFSEDELR